ncbi:MAG: hypothetical protein VYA86_05035 [Candidatus Thermoplasmatota archaeon]|nr:hypothetical protein [Candidatus Thermoplasmatota archaeon]
MQKRVLPLLLVAMMLPMMSIVVSAQDESHIVVAGSGAFAIDENYDGELDLVRVIASIGTSAPTAIIAVEVIADNDDMAISFWNNTTLESGESLLLNTTIKAWADGEYHITLRVWDTESGLLTHDEDLGVHELIASLTPPHLSMELEAEDQIYTGDTCLIHRISTDLVGAHYGVMGVVSIQGVPWLVGEYETPLDCSRWPAGDYTITEHYRNGLGMTASETLSFSIDVHPPPSFAVNKTGRATESGTPCNMEIIPSDDTVLEEVSIHWEIVDPAQDVTSYEDLEILDCTMWSPGVHKVRATLTSPQGRETTHALNLVRLPPAPDASLEVLNASGDSNRWPTISQGDQYEPTPLLMSLSATIALVGSGGFVFALLLGLFVGKRMSQEPEIEGDIWNTVDEAPDSEGLPTFVDESGVHWRQQPDGSVDWWDATEKRWERFQQ